MDANTAAKALAAPAQRGRNRIDRDKMPKPGATSEQTATPSSESLTNGQEPSPEVTQIRATPTTEQPASESAGQPRAQTDTSVRDSPVKTEEKKARPTKSSVKKQDGPIDQARVRLAIRTAEQTFLPLVSRIAKLNDWIGQAELAVADAKIAGVDSEHLEDTLRGVARKNSIGYTDIPEPVRAAITAETESGPNAFDPARSRLAARTAEQTFLPLVSRIAKLSEWVDQAVLAIEDAKGVGVDSEHLEDTLRGVARKNSIGYTNIPETVRAAITVS